MAKASSALTAYKAGLKAKGKTKHKKPGFTLPVAVLAGFAPLGFGLLGAVRRGLAGDTAGAAQQATIYATGYNTDTKAFHWDVFMGSYGPILAGMIVHKLAGKFGINRALAQAGVPILRI